MWVIKKKEVNWKKIESWEVIIPQFAFFWWTTFIESNWKDYKISSRYTKNHQNIKKHLFKIVLCPNQQLKQSSASAKVHEQEW